ncbi:cytochrome c family protein [Roseomonas nepalensis]|uniref:Cytochrome c family protein n=2 Tax=Muricoccus nepalensis TaxID=1854500 RepID=A0A502G235_9PROT|nr:cytochrome c family protein [Roseomonas nepalensis]
MRRSYALAAAACCAVIGLSTLYLWSESPDPRPQVDPGTPITALLADADAGRGARLFHQCTACHTIRQGSPDLDGPNLYGVLGAPVAGNRPRYGYSAALRSAGGRWDVERMDDWLRSPRGTVPGTRMAFQGIPAARDRADLIAYLDTEGPAPLFSPSSP